jgi:hypothetical protein
MKITTFLLALLAGIAIHVQAAVPPPEQLLPDDTLLMVTLPDCSKALRAYHDSPHGQLWNDPAMKDFRDKFIAKCTEQWVKPLEHDLGVSLADYTNLAQGQLTFAITQNGLDSKGAEEPGMLLLVDSGDKSDILKKRLADLKKNWVDSGKTIRTEKIRDVDFSVVTISSDDLPKRFKGAGGADADAGDSAGSKPKTAEKTTIYIGQSQSLLILGSSSGPIEKILARMSGGEVKSVSDLSAFSANAGLFRDAQMFAWLNTSALVNLVNTRKQDSDDSSANPLSFKPDKIIAAIGLNGLKSVAMSYIASDDGSRFNVVLSAPESTRAGIFKIIAGVPKEYSAPPFVPSDTVKFQRYRIDGQDAWATLRQIVNGFSPGATMGIDLALGSAEEAAKQKDPSFDIKKDLFGNLGDDLITYQKLSADKAPTDISGAPAVFLIGSPNAERLAMALKSLMVLYSAQGAETKDRDFLGHKIYTMSLPAMGPGGSRALNYSASGGYLAISMDSGMIEDYLRNGDSPSKSLRDAPGLSDAMQKVGGGGTSLFGYSNDSELMRASLEALRANPDLLNPMSGAFAPLMTAAGVGGDVKMQDWFDFSLLPPFDKISKYLYFHVYSGGANDQGIVFKTFSPTPPQLKK